MTEAPTVLVANADGPPYEALLSMAALVERGILRPFWHVGPGVPSSRRQWTATYFDRWGETEVPLFSSLGEQQSERIHLAAVATAGDSVESALIAETVQAVGNWMEELAPPGAGIRRFRVWFPDWERNEPPDPSFFTTAAHANVMVVPEDRRADGFVAAPVTPPEGQPFVGHVASELAVLLGLFSGMESTPLEEMKPGVIFGSNPKVRLVRSFVRIAHCPAVPLQSIVDHGGRLPVPPGTVEAPAPQAAVADLAERFEPLLERLAFRVRPPAPPERRQLGPGRTLLLVVKEMAGFVLSLPRRAVEGMLEDFSELAGRTMQELIGASSVVEVVWRGKLKPHGDREGVDAQVEDLKSQAERRLDLEGGPSIDQRLWRDISQVILSAIDGGDLPGGLEPVEVRGRRAVINEAAEIAPRPAETLVETATVILEESESDHPSTLLGRMGASIRRIAASNRQATAMLLESLDANVSVLAGYRPPSLALAHVMGALFLAALIVTVLLFSGAVRDLGVTEMDALVRDVTFGVLTAGCALFLWLFRSYAKEAQAEQTPKGAHLERSLAGVGWAEPVVGAVIGVAAAALFVVLGVTYLGYPATEPASYSALLAGAVTGAGLGQAFGLGRRQHELASLGRMARLSILAVLVYVSVLFVGAVSQPDGWYATATDEQLGTLLGFVSGLLAALLIAVLIYVSWTRVAERLTVNTYGSSIRQLAEQVNDAFVGDRVADAALEQFLGLSTVLSRLVWYPYGRSSAVTAERIEIDGFGLNKAQIREFGLSERGRNLFEARTTSLAAERSWLDAQYEKSIARFREAKVPLVGDVALDSVGRPDEDPMTVAHYDLETRSERGDRWRWAEDLFAGKYDAELLSSVRSIGEDDVFRPILASSDSFEPVRTRSAEQSVVEFISEILPGDSAEVEARYFDPAHLTSDSLDRRWHTQIWWPEERLFKAAATGDPHAIQPLGSMPLGRVWIAIRADMTEDLQPAALFGEGPSAEAEPAPPGPDF